jgi:hypothetical protein
LAISYDGREYFFSDERKYSLFAIVRVLIVVTIIQQMVYYPCKNLYSVEENVL